MRNQIRTLISAWKAAPYTQLRAADHRSWTYDRLAKEIAAAAEYTVVHGPYRAMKYFDSRGVPIIDRQPTMKIIGSFEQEIQPWIESFIGQEVPQIIHLGAGEGYHAVGMAMRIPRSRSIVFDTLIPARKACKFLAQQNGVASRIQLRGFAGGEQLADVDFAGSLVFSDCGGAELVLLDPTLFPSLRLATILVETHDFFDNRISPRLLQRFRETHRIETVTVSERDPRRYAFLDGFPPSTARMAIEETRHATKDGKPQAWMLMTPYTS
jgi:hypothetical protein